VIGEKLCSTREEADMALPIKKSRHLDRKTLTLKARSAPPTYRAALIIGQIASGEIEDFTIFSTTTNVLH